MIPIRLLLAVIIFAALIIVRELIMSRDGMLRKILIFYFIVEILAWGTLLYMTIKYVFPPFFVRVTLLVLLPKFIVKMFFLWYVLPKEKGRKLY